MLVISPNESGDMPETSEDELKLASAPESLSKAQVVFFALITLLALDSLVLTDSPAETFRASKLLVRLFDFLSDGGFLFVITECVS